MELLAFSPSDDGEDTDVLEYEDADSELADEDMRSTISSVENMDDDATISVEDMDDELLPRRTLLLETVGVYKWNDLVLDTYSDLDRGSTWKLGPAQPIPDAKVTFLSLRQVTVVRRALAQMNPLIPRSKLRFDDIISIRKVFRCTCKTFMNGVL
ncbi:hypothetical protein PC120_g19050 [Phytophthora cactorum]|nr:hypothetical protein PC120_g19050 [Phytophthora cactorum]